MKPDIFFFLILVFFCSRVCAQESVKFTLEEKNITGRDLHVYKTEYYPDSTKAYSSFQSPKGTSAGLVSELHHIRIDYIAIDVETRDTVCKISAFKKDLESGLILFETGVNTIKPPFNVQPRLRIKGTGYKNVIKTGDPIEIKLISNKKIAGRILTYDNNKITVLNKDNQKVEIIGKEIKGIKSCRYLFTYGARVAILKNCKYSKIRNVKFELVEQKFNTKKRFWDWVKKE